MKLWGERASSSGGSGSDATPAVPTEGENFRSVEDRRSSPSLITLIAHPAVNMTIAFVSRASLKKFFKFPDARRPRPSDGGFANPSKPRS